MPRITIRIEADDDFTDEQLHDFADTLQDQFLDDATGCGHEHWVVSIIGDDGSVRNLVKPGPNLTRRRAARKSQRHGRSRTK